MVDRWCESVGVLGDGQDESKTWYSLRSRRRTCSGEAWAGLWETWASKVELKYVTWQQAIRSRKRHSDFGYFCCRPGRCLLESRGVRRRSMTDEGRC
jgi:hypothetical protein